MNLIKLVLIAPILLFTYSSTLLACELPAGRVLKIACLDECLYSVKNSIQKISRNLNYKVRIDKIQSFVIDPAIAYDGFIIPGGVDISPSYYNNDLPVELSRLINSLDYLVEYTEDGRRRDQIEYNFVRNYRTDERYAQTPLIGICRGLQMMSVGSGIPLYVDIKKELGIPNREDLFDKINFLDTNSEISKLFGTTPFRGYKYHHQALRYDYFQSDNLEVKTGVKVLAVSNQNKIPEVIKFNNRPAIGTQFHPELTDEDDVKKKFFTWFLQKSCEKAIL